MAFEKIKQFIVDKLSPKQDSVEAGTGYARPVTPEMKEFDKVSQREDRRSKIQDSTEMANTDPRVARMLYKLRTDSCVNGVSVEVQSASNESAKDAAQEIIDTFMERCKVVKKLPGWVKATVRDGEAFLEVVVDDNSGEIVRLKKLAASITHSNENSEGNFPEGEPAYYQAHPWMFDQKIKTFERWQIIHIKWDEEDGKPYGTPLFSPGRLTWKRVDGSEKTIVARRQINGMKLHHKVGSPERPDWEQVKKYRDENRDTIDHPLEPVSNFFTTGNVDIKEIAADRSIGEIRDIKHLEGLLFALTGIPPALFGGGNEVSVNRDILELMEKDYYKVIQDINDLFEAGLREAITFALLLQDINTDSIEYTFNWGAKDREDSDAKIARAKELQSLGFSFETVFGVCDLDGITFEDEMERIKRQVAEGIVPYGLGTKLDPVLAQLLLGVMAKPAGNEEVAEQLSKLTELAERQMEPGVLPLRVARR